MTETTIDFKKLLGYRIVADEANDALLSAKLGDKLAVKPGEALSAKVGGKIGDKEGKKGED